MEMQATLSDTSAPCARDFAPMPKGVFWTRKVRKSGEAFYYYAWRGGPLIAKSSVRLTAEELTPLVIEAKGRKAIPVGAIDDILDELFVSAKKRARHDGRDFSIARAELTEIAIRQGWRCAVSGIEFSHAKDEKHFRSPWRPSLDRIDASRGYAVGNVRLVLVAVNIAMGEWGERVFTEIARAVAARR